MSTEHKIWGHVLSFLLKYAVFAFTAEQLQGLWRGAGKSLLHKVVAGYCLEKE